MTSMASSPFQHHLNHETFADKFCRENPENHVLVYADYLQKLASVVPSEEEAESSSRVSVGGVALQEFSKLAFPKTGEAAAGFSDKTKPILRQKLNAALAKFVKRPEDFGEFCNAIMSIDSSSVEMDDELQSELIEALEKLQDLTSPKKTKGDKSGAFQGLALLYAVAILQLYNEEPDAVDILSDLKQCYEKLLSKQKDKDTDISALLVEILLAMVARPSQLMRQTAERVFEGFTSLMTAEALTLLTDTLAATENAEGLRALFDTDADMEDAEEADGSGDDDEESGLDSDVEIVDLKDAAEADEDSGSENGEAEEDGSEDEEDEDEDEEEDDTKTDQYKALDDDLAKLLNSHRLDKDKDAASSDDDSDVSDSEMMALDDRISAAFKMRMKDASKKKENRDAKETVVNFKHRALDLLAIFAKKEAASPLTLSLLVPLLQLMRTTKTRDLVKKAGNIISELPKAQKKIRGSSNNKEGEEQQQEEGEEKTDSDTTALEELLQKIHEEMPEDDSHAFAKAASTASLLVVNAILTKNVGMFQIIWDIYGGLAMEWAMFGGFQFSTIITDWTNWIQSHPKLVAKRMPHQRLPKAQEKESEDSDEEMGEEND